MPSYSENVSRMHRALTGSDNLGGYEDSVGDRLMSALDAGWELIEAGGLMNEVRVIAGSAVGPFASKPLSKLDDVREQVTSRFRFDASSKPRNLAEAAAQLEVLVTVLTKSNPAPPPPPTTGGALPAGQTQGEVSWAAKTSGGDSTAWGFKPNLIQRQWGSGAIETSSKAVPVGNAPEGSRGLVFHLPAGQGRLEVQPPVLQSMKSGESAYFGFWVVFDSVVERDRDPWALIAQWHGNDTTSPQQIIAADGGDLITGNRTTFKRFYNGRIKAGKRYDIVTKVSATAGGPQSVWVNGELVLAEYKAGLNKLPLYLKTGLYRQPNGSPDQTLWMGGQRVGTGYGSAYPLP